MLGLDSALVSSSSPPTRERQAAHMEQPVLIGPVILGRGCRGMTSHCHSFFSAQQPQVDVGGARCLPLLRIGIAFPRWLAFLTDRPRCPRIRRVEFFRVAPGLAWLCRSWWLHSSLGTPAPFPFPGGLRGDCHMRPSLPRRRESEPTGSVET